MKLLRRVTAVGLLARLHAAPVSILPFLIGIFIRGVPAWPRVLTFSLLGLTLHVFACALNDAVDLPSDRRNPNRARSPLVTGALARSTAYLVALFGSLSYLGLAVGMFGSTWLLPIALLILILQAYANACQKISRVGPLPIDLLFGVAMGTPVLLGAFSSPRQYATVAILFSAGLSMQMACLNVVGGNLKDLAADLSVGARTTAIDFGVRPSSDPRFAVFTSRYMRLVWTLELCGGGLLLATTLVGAPSTHVKVISSLVLMALLTISIWDLERMRCMARPSALGGRELFILANVFSLYVLTGILGGIESATLMFALSVGSACVVRGVMHELVVTTRRLDAATTKTESR